MQKFKLRELKTGKVFYLGTDEELITLANKSRSQAIKNVFEAFYVLDIKGFEVTVQ